MTTLSTLLFLGALLAQDPSDVSREPPPGPPVLSLGEIELSHYTPQHADPHELWALATDMVGRRFYVEERGGYASEPVSNLSLLGRSLVLFDTPDYQRRMLAAIGELDQPVQGGTRRADEPLETLEYRPRYLSLDAVLRSLDSFVRQVSDGETYYDNVSFARERGLLVVREHRSRVAEIRALLERIDVPQPRVMISCLLISGDQDGGEDTGLPEELSLHLRKLVPGYAFDSVGFALIQASAIPGAGIQMKIDTTQLESYQLSFLPVAFDASQGSLSVTQCTLTRSPSAGGGVSAVQGLERIFSTDTMFRSGEYTVLGTTGMEPVFVVVRVTPLDS